MLRYLDLSPVLTDGPEGRFYGIGRPYALPVLGRKVVEGHQFLPIFLQANSGLRILRFIGRVKQIEGLVGMGFGL